MSDINQPSFPTPFSFFLFFFCSCVCFCLYDPFNCISFHEFFRQLSAFSLCYPRLRLTPRDGIFADLDGVHLFLYTGGVGGVVGAGGVVHVAAVEQFLRQGWAASGHDVRRFFALGVALGMREKE